MPTRMGSKASVQVASVGHLCSPPSWPPSWAPSFYGCPLGLGAFSLSSQGHASGVWGGSGQKLSERREDLEVGKDSWRPDRRAACDRGGGQLGEAWREGERPTGRDQRLSLSQGQPQRKEREQRGRGAQGPGDLEGPPLEIRPPKPSERGGLPTQDTQGTQHRYSGMRQ